MGVQAAESEWDSGYVQAAGSQWEGWKVSGGWGSWLVGKWK